MRFSASPHIFADGKLVFSGQKEGGGLDARPCRDLSKSGCRDARFRRYCFLDRIEYAYVYRD